MVYNTDRFDNYTTENSILNSETVEPYLNRDLGFSLPLDIALPVFQWNIIFRNNRFVRIARPFEEPDSGEEVRHEQVPASELIKTMELLNRYLHTDSARHSTILYHLDSTNIDKYSHEDIKGIYNQEPPLCHTALSGVLVSFTHTPRQHDIPSCRRRGTILCV